jgi:hypothetical protein
MIKMEPSIFTSTYTALSEAGITTACVIGTIKNTTVDAALSALCPLQLEIGRHITLEHENIFIFLGGSIATNYYFYHESFIRVFCTLVTTPLVMGTTNILSDRCKMDYKNPLETLSELYHTCYQEEVKNTLHQ